MVSLIQRVVLSRVNDIQLFLQDAKNKNVEHILILSGDHLYRMDYMDFVQVFIQFIVSKIVL